jgi:hypothetical protein
MRVGDVAGMRSVAATKARPLYLSALLRARGVSSLDGVLRAAEAFAALGDREVVDQAIVIAAKVAAQERNVEARAAATGRVEQASARLGARQTAAGAPVFF